MSDAGWYDAQYGDDPEAGNPFGSEMLARTPNRALLSHVRAGGSPLTFPRPSNPSTRNVMAEIAAGWKN